MGLGPGRSANWMRRISSVYDLSDDRAEKNHVLKKKYREILHAFAYISAHFLLHASKHVQMFSACCCHTFNASITSFVFELFWLRAFLRFVSQMIKETLIQPLSSRQFSRLLLFHSIDLQRSSACHELLTLLIQAQ